jgi:hypothetical protein
MSETEKQEGQKTVVAFIAGLLIGGLLVWVFSSTPEEVDEEPVTTDTEVTDTTNNNTVERSVTTVDREPVQEVVGDGSITVSKQTAGSVVTLGAVSFPTVAGWVVVRDYVDGNPGNVLGASRYDQNEGLSPDAVSLLRSTEAGSSYQVVFYNENGDRVFDLDDDTIIDGIAATFVAQ